MNGLTEGCNAGAYQMAKRYSCLVVLWVDGCGVCHLCRMRRTQAPCPAATAQQVAGITTSRRSAA
jgi:Zn-dependent alcohol dehydrogenase